MQQLGARLLHWYPLSSGCGAMYLPPLVFNNSFFRSVMTRKPQRKAPARHRAGSTSDGGFIECRGSGAPSLITAGRSAFPPLPIGTGPIGTGRPADQLVVQAHEVLPAGLDGERALQEHERAVGVAELPGTARALDQEVDVVGLDRERALQQAQGRLRLQQLAVGAGHGAIEGVAGPESANNAGAQTSFIPLLTLGIPPNAVMAIMVGLVLLVWGMFQAFPRINRRAVRLLWCPERAERLRVEVQEDPWNGALVAVDRCSAFSPPDKITCAKACLRSGETLPVPTVLRSA